MALGTPADWFRGIRPVQKARDDATLDGYRAHQFHLVHSPTETALPQDLRARRDQLELQVMALRDTKAQFSEAEYFAKLEPLLRDIARIYEQAEPSGAITEESRSRASDKHGRHNRVRTARENPPVSGGPSRQTVS